MTLYVFLRYLEKLGEHMIPGSLFIEYTLPFFQRMLMSMKMDQND